MYSPLNSQLVLIPIILSLDFNCCVVILLVDYEEKDVRTDKFQYYFATMSVFELESEIY